MASDPPAISPEHTSGHAIGLGMEVSLRISVAEEGTAPRPAATPLTYVHGSGVLPAGLEARLLGEVAGARRSYVLGPAEAYGEADPRLLKAVPIASLPVKAPRAGMRLATRDADGSLTPMTVVMLQDDIALLDFNHRLAGKTVRFDVEVLSVGPEANLVDKPKTE